jgi:hypothetical protein
MFGDYVPGAPGLLDDYFKANPLSWLNFDQSTPVDKIKQNQLTNTLLTVGGALSAAGAKSYDPGHSAKAMAGLGQGLQNVQQGAFDQVQGLQDQQDREEMFSWQKAKYDADMAHKLKVFGWDMEQKAQEIKAKAEAAKRAQMESDRNYGLAQDKFDYQQQQDTIDNNLAYAKLTQTKLPAGMYLDEAGQPTYHPGYIEGQRQINAAKAQPPTGYQYNDQAQLVAIPGGPADRNTDTELTAAGYANRMIQAGDIMANLEGKGYDPSNLQDHAMGALPGVLGNSLVSQEAQSYRQAQEDWVRAKLRKESGAVIADEEMAREISTYFPMPGDSKETILQKARARQIAESNLIASSQGAYQKQFAPQGGIGASPVTNSPQGGSVDLKQMSTSELIKLIP